MTNYETTKANLLALAREQLQLAENAADPETTADHADCAHGYCEHLAQAAWEEADKRSQAEER